jgi:hypothetical protein
MNIGKTIFSQLVDFLPKRYFDNLVVKYKGNHRVRKFSCWDQFLCMAFAQFTYRESLRDIESCLCSMKSKLYHTGIKGKVSRNNLANANINRDWRIFQDFGQHLIKETLKLYNKDDLIFKELENTLYALDATTVDLCLSLYPWAQFRKEKSALKINTLLDIRTSLPTLIDITSGKIHEINTLDIIPIEPLAIYLMDKGYIDYKRLYKINNSNAYFIVRKKRNLAYRRIRSVNVKKYPDIRHDQIIKLTGYTSSTNYPEKLRSIKYHDTENNRNITYITNHLTLSPMIVAALYKERWKIELFFKWIKQHLRIKAFCGTTENAVKIQIWIAITTYVLILHIIKKLKLEESPYTILQILSVHIFNKELLYQLLTKSDDPVANNNLSKQLFLFN